MKTQLKYSWIYNNQFDKEFSYKDLAILMTKTRQFITLFDKNINKILELIPKFTGYKWPENDLIKFYIVNEKGHSFSDPLTLKYYENNKLMFVILIHELAHYNINYFIKDSSEREQVMDLIAYYVCKELKIDIKKELEFLESIRKKQNKNFKKINFDLEKNNLRYYLERK